MRILIFEYITGGGFLSGILPDSLCAEGELMLAALLRDLLAIEGLSLTVLRDVRLGKPLGLEDGIEWIFLEEGHSLHDQLNRQIGRADAVWPIAPESGGVLEGICRMVEASEKQLFSCSSTAVNLAASKYRTSLRLESCGVPVVETRICRNSISCPPETTFPWVIKPDDGAGCDGARILRSSVDWESAMQALPLANEWVAQPLVEGEPLSISALFAGGVAEVIAINRQHIVYRDDGFILQGCGVNAFEGPASDFIRLAQRVAAACPEISGYAGIDLIKTASGLKVLEVNPRLTSSYAGIRASTGINPARYVIELFTIGKPGRLPAWKPRPVEVCWGVC